MTDVVMVATTISLMCSLFALYNLYRISISQSARIKALEHFIYPEFEQERGFKWVIHELQ